VDLIVAAATQLPAAVRQRLVVLCAGDGDRRGAIEAAARAGCVRLIAAGYQSQRALSRCYHAADVLVLPSLHGETWGLVVNEALHHGVPCIVSDRVGCAPDLIDGTTGLVCEAASAPALAQAIVRSREWTDNPGQRDACRQKVSGYSVGRAAAGIAEAYRAVTRGRIAA
jgi:glycosyltransferase involved in cell wall biosynthesis